MSDNIEMSKRVSDGGWLIFDLRTRLVVVVLSTMTAPATIQRKNWNNNKS